ncbi:hypothetical protein H0E87_030292 [Populus deltoides]|uniref:F-box/LRR-repeat protein 15-like leucin rich repeat domain-containing protein n=1 Tax=Populus deltoides TaxID=3696 RepID=A0A8T2WJY3_POPDE|nr:hypothetical protein H0E87_030292 [Populus deltoides]
MRTNKKTTCNCNLFDFLTEEIIFTILDYLNDDPFAKKSFSLTCKAFYSIESHHRKTLKPLRAELLLRTLHRYPHIEHLDLTVCPRIEDSMLNVVSLACKDALCSINLSRSRFFTNIGLSSLVSSCFNLVEIDLSNGVELNDLAAAAIAEAKNLEKLWLARCKLITDLGIGCVAVGCRKLRLICLKWCLKISDLGVQLLALKCKEIRSLDLSYLQITEKCLPSILQLQHLEDLVLEGCLGINDDGLSTVQQSCKSLKTLNMSNCHNHSHVGLSSLINGAENLTRTYFSLWPFLSAQGRGDSLSFLVQGHKELRKLDITCCRMIMYDSVDSITSSCRSLTSLRMESCSLVPKEAFVLFGQRCQLMEELDVTDTKIDDEGLKSISRCSKLSSLKLGICMNITDNGLKHIGSRCSKLKELDLYRSLGITDEGIAAVTFGCPDLEVINIAYNDKVTDASLISLSGCSRLRVLEIRGCPHVSSKGLSAIAVGCRQLMVLDIKKCFNINDNAMLSLAQFSQNLKQINLSYCSVTDVGLLALASVNRLQNITVLHLGGLTPNGLAAALLACRGITKVKLHASFKPLIPKSLLVTSKPMAVYFIGEIKHSRSEYPPFLQVEMDTKGWKLHFGKSAEAP